MENVVDDLYKGALEIKYCCCMKPVAGEYKKLSFFPAGTGTIDQSLNLDDKNIMILGQDWGTYKYWNANKETGENPDSNSTWRNLLKKILPESGIKPLSCFFTNAVMGVRVVNRETGESPAFNCPSFIEQCTNFFDTQIQKAKPQIVLVLGQAVANFLAIWRTTEFSNWSKSPSIKKVYQDSNQVIRLKNLHDENYVCFILIHHPCMWHLNGNIGLEIKAIKECVENSIRQ